MSKTKKILGILVGFFFIGIFLHFTKTMEKTKYIRMESIGYSKIKTKSLKSDTPKQHFNSSLDFNRFKPEIKRRFDEVQTKCEEYEKERKVPNRFPPKMYSRILVNDKYRVLFCLVPKVSATTWRRMFLKMSGKVGKRLYKMSNHDIFYKMKNMLRTLYDYNKNGVEFRLKNYTKVLFVRDPLERLLSAYRSKFVNNNEFHQIYGRKIISKYRANATEREKREGSNVTFLEFVKFITDKRPAHGSFNLHWSSYWTLCYPCTIRYDYIGRFENLPREADEILNYLGTKGIDFPRRSLFYNATKTKDVFNKYYSQIPPNYLRRIRELYDKDFNLFSFS